MKLIIGFILTSLIVVGISFMVWQLYQETDTTVVEHYDENNENNNSNNANNKIEIIINLDKDDPIREQPSTIIYATKEKEELFEKIIVQAVDSYKKPFFFNYYILGGGYEWIYGSCEEIEHPRNVDSFETYMKNYLSVKERLQEAKEIIAVGAASQEYVNPDYERERAFIRANHLKAILTKYSAATQLHTLNLGIYQGSKINSSYGSFTGPQRQVVFITIVKKRKDAHFDLEKELFDILQKNPNNHFPFKINNYSDFTLNLAITARYLDENCKLK